MTSLMPTTAITMRTRIARTDHETQTPPQSVQALRAICQEVYRPGALRGVFYR